MKILKYFKICLNLKLFKLKKILNGLTCWILTTRIWIARWGEVSLVFYPSQGLQGTYPIGAYISLIKTTVSVFTIHCHTIIILEVTTCGVHVCIIVILFFSLTNTGFASDDHFSGRRLAIICFRKLK